MVLDLDHFKKINDTYGHRLGDRVLQLFAGTLADELDTGSILGRLGGEEFAAILPGADLSAAAAKAECVRAAFADIAAVIDGLPVGGTVSIGVASNDDIDCDIGALFHRADGALYAAKQTGRNRVQVIGPKEPMLFEDTGSRRTWCRRAGSASAACRRRRSARRGATAARPTPPRLRPRYFSPLRSMMRSTAWHGTRNDCQSSFLRGSTS